MPPLLDPLLELLEIPLLELLEIPLLELLEIPLLDPMPPLLDPLGVPPLEPDPPLPDPPPSGSPTFGSTRPMQPRKGRPAMSTGAT
jgi:hypothetical protein